MNNPNPEIPLDKEAIYDNELKPLIDQMHAICKREGMPMVACVSFRFSPEGEQNAGMSHLPLALRSRTLRMEIITNIARNHELQPAQVYAIQAILSGTVVAIHPTDKSGGFSA